MPLLQNGQTALPLILLISVIIIEFAIAGVFIAYFMSTSGQGERLNARALSAAKAGLQDALVRIARDKNFPNTTYNLTVGDDSVTINVSKNLSNNTFTVTSTASAGTRKKRLVGTISIDNTTGKAGLISTIEASAQ